MADDAAEADARVAQRARDLRAEARLVAALDAHAVDALGRLAHAGVRRPPSSPWRPSSGCEQHALARDAPACGARAPSRGSRPPLASPSSLSAAPPARSSITAQTSFGGFDAMVVLLRVECEHNLLPWTDISERGNRICRGRRARDRDSVTASPAQSLEQIKQRLIRLAARHELFTGVRFPTAGARRQAQVLPLPRGRGRRPSLRALRELVARRPQARRRTTTPPGR